MSETEVCIVGGGVMGLAAAHELAKVPNLRITIVDRFGIGNRFCASNDFNRMFCFANGRRKRYTALAVESLRLWRELEHEAGQELFVPTGFLAVEGEDDEWNEFMLDSQRTLSNQGLPVEELEEADMSRRFPQVRAERGILDPGAGVLLARKVLWILRSLVERAGVSIIEGEEVVGIRPAENPSVETRSGKSIRCKRLIVATGAWTNSLLRGDLMSVTPTRQQVAYIQPTNRERFRPGIFPMVAFDNYCVMPTAGADSVKVGYHGSAEAGEPETVNWTPDPRAIESCVSVVRKYVPDLGDGEVVDSKVGLYDKTRHSNFVIGQDPECKSVVYGYGFSGHGFKFAPLIGRTLAELVLEKPSSVGLERFAPVR
jgi:sarcosine oxidase